MRTLKIAEALITYLQSDEAWTFTLTERGSFTALCPTTYYDHMYEAMDAADRVSRELGYEISEQMQQVCR